MKQPPLLFSRRYSKLPTIQETDSTKEAYVYHYNKVLKKCPRHFKFNHIDIFLSSLRENNYHIYKSWKDYPILKNVYLYNRQQLYLKIIRERKRSTIKWIWSLQKLKI